MHCIDSAVWLGSRTAVYQFQRQVTLMDHCEAAMQRRDAGVPTNNWEPD